ncbi:hypothetical protein BKA58DRAFT_299583, partial [Alternaria rosae]|uniref:uncharacterized protein n=1 Tax=Alternaria rosae TaxID=1187941 RepID=UPI001E8CE92C
PGPYGPNNPPPPPSEPPPRASEIRGRSSDDVDGERMQGRRRPQLVVRKRDYARAEEELRVRQRDCDRSRSPARHQDIWDEKGRRGERARYRERSPLRREPVEVDQQRDDRRPEKAEYQRCFACNKKGHRVADCKAAFTDKKGCFRCGERGHIARACKVRVGQIKTDVGVAANESKGMAGRYGDRDDDRYRSPKQDAVDGHIADYAFRTGRMRDASRLDAHIQHVYGQDQDAQQHHRDQSSEGPSRSGYFVEDEVDWDDDALETDDIAPAVRMSTGRKIPQPEQLTHEGPHRHHQAKSAKEPKLGLPHLQDADTEEFPPTAHDLRGYDYRIFTTYASKPKPQRFVNGANGKVAPGMYGSEQRHDLGLCFTTYLTKKRCEMGVRCPWRHHPLSNSERAWIIVYGKQKGKEFIENVDRWWSFPEVPVPGATMQGLGDD